MGERAAAVDRYIAKARPFARPILERVRDVVHAACPDVEETIKWGMPFFVVGQPLCFMAAFQAHAAFGFWRHKDLARRLAAPGALSREAMGSLGRLTTLADLPARRALVALVRTARRLGAERAAQPPRPRRPARPAPRPPAWMLAALRRVPRALATWRSLPPGQRREYVEWLTDAKTQPTRERRLRTAVAQLAQGLARNARYARR